MVRGPVVLILYSMKYKHRNMKSFNEIIRSETPVLVDFFATWCGPCKMMTPILQELKTAMGDKVTIVKIDVDKNPQVAGHFNVQGVPTLMIFRNGEAKWRQSGVMQAKQLQQLINQYQAA